MKNWGWILLLAVVYLLLSIIIVMVIEKINGLPFFSSKTIPIVKNLSNESITEDNVVELAPAVLTPLKTQQPPKIISTIKSRPQYTPAPKAPKLSSNIISNSSFESDPLSSVPNWRPTGQGAQHVIEWSNELAANGQYALKISATHPSNHGWPGWQTQLEHKANKGYLLQAKYYTADGANAWLDLSFLDSHQRLLKGFSTGCSRLSVRNTWTSIERKVKSEWIPKESRVVKIALRQCLNHTKGRSTTLYFDDVSLQYLP